MNKGAPIKVWFNLQIRIIRKASYNNYTLIYLYQVKNIYCNKCSLIYLKKVSKNKPSLCYLSFLFLVTSGGFWRFIVLQGHPVEQPSSRTCYFGTILLSIIALVVMWQMLFWFFTPISCVAWNKWFFGCGS